MIGISIEMNCQKGTVTEISEFEVRNLTTGFK